MSKILKLNKFVEKNTEFELKPSLQGIVRASLENASEKLSPLWDIRDYVAVNPFFGFKEESFLETAKYIKSFSSKGILPEKEFFLKKFKSKEITEYDLEIAKKLYQREQNSHAFDAITTEDLINFIQSENESKFMARNKSISDIYDSENQTLSTNHITNEISKWCAAYFDETQSTWKIPTENLRLYSWWKSLAKYDNPFWNVNNSFSEIINSLPHQPENAIEYMVEKLSQKIELNEHELTNYFYCLTFSILGWSSYIRKFEFEANRSGDTTQLDKVGGLVDILAMRMAYDISLFEETQT